MTSLFSDYLTTQLYIAFLSIYLIVAEVSSLQIMTKFLDDDSDDNGPTS